MDQNTNTTHSSDESGVTNFNLCNESADGEENVANVFKRNSKNQTSSSGPQTSKRMKIDGEDKSEMAAVVSNHEQSPDIYKLPLELLAATFDYLSLKDLCSIRQTSKWFHEVAGFCYQTNYSALKRDLRRQKDIDLSPFHGLIQSIKIAGNDFLTHPNEHEYFFNRRSEFKQIKTVTLSGVDFADVKLEYIKEIAGEIEYLRISGSVFGSRVIEKIPVLFPNLKTLSMLDQHPGQYWVACKCPNLERFELDGKNVAIGPFLEMNPNIRKLAMDTRCLWKNREAMKSVKLEDLAIFIPQPRNRKPYVTSESLCQLLNELYELGSYERLKVYLMDYDYNRKNQFIKLSSLRGLTKLHLICSMHSGRNFTYLPHYSLSIFQHLKEMSITFSWTINDIEATVDSLKNLERIEFDYAYLVDIKTFIKRSRKLTKIKVNNRILPVNSIKKSEKNIILTKRDVDRFKKQNIINLLSLNAERSKLQDAKSVTIYVPEEVYLATKWTMKETDFEFIQLRRFASFQWDDDFFSNSDVVPRTYVNYVIAI